MSVVHKFIGRNEKPNDDAPRLYKLPNKQDLQHMSSEDIIQIVDLICKDCVSDFNVRMNQNQFMTNLALELTNRLKKDGNYKASKVIGLLKDDPEMQATSDIKKDNSEVSKAKGLYFFDRNTVEFRAAKIFHEHLGIEPDKVVMSARIEDDLGSDSLDNIELIMAFEEEFNIEIPDDVAYTIETVEDAVKFIKGSI